MSESPAAIITAEAIPTAQSDDSAAARPDAVFHAVLLALSAGILLAACALRVQQGERVLIAGLNLPLPEMCTLKRTTGLACPGCGLTRSFVSLARGEVAEAFAFNAAGPYLFLLLAAQIPYRGAQLWRIRRGLAEWHCGAWQWWPAWLFVALLLTQWGLRMAAMGG